MSTLFRRARRAERPHRRTGRQPVHLSLLRFEERAVPATLQLSAVPNLEAAAGVKPVAGEPFPYGALVATFIDPDGSYKESDFTGTIDWGDGQSSQATFRFLAPPAFGRTPFFQVYSNHTYAAAGTYTVHVSVQDVDGDSGQLDEPVTVIPPPRLPVFGQSIYILPKAGAAFSGVVASFTDVDGNADATKYSATIDWGDGHTSQGVIQFTDPNTVGQTPFDVHGSHTYTALGNFTVRVTIHDTDGDSTEIDTQAYVAPPAYYTVGAGAGLAPEVKVYDAATGALKFEFMAYDPAFRGGVRVAVADVNGDGVPDIITGAGPGGGPHVKVFDGVTGNVIDSFYAYAPTFAGGVFVAGGDIQQNGKADIVTGAGPGGGPHVKVFSGADLSVLDSFYAYAPNFSGGVSVAVGEVNDDGIADIITGAGPGGGPHVKVFSGADLSVLASFYAYSPNFTGGVTVAGGDMNGDDKAEIITGMGPGGAPLVNIFSIGSGMVGSFLAYPADTRSGVTVATAFVSGDAFGDIVTGPGPGGSSQIKTFNGATHALIDEFTAFDPASLNGVFVG
jgi:hypothetical protein